MTKNKFIPFFIFLASALFLFGQNGNAAGFIDGLEDIPLPEYMQQTSHDDLSFGNEESRFVETYLTGKNENFEEVEKFYMDTLPQLGWQFEGKQGNTISFYRDGERLDIAREKTSPLTVRITLKSQN